MQRVREGLAGLFGLPDDYLVVLGNGGATAFWDVAAFGLIAGRSPAPELRRVLARSSRRVTAAAPWLADPSVLTSATGTHRLAQAEPGIDAYALPS